MNGFQQPPCPRCGSAGNVHSIQELGAMAQARLDQLVFLAGGRAVLPMPDLNTLTVDQADAMVATLRLG